MSDYHVSAEKHDLKHPMLSINKNNEQDTDSSPPEQSIVISVIPSNAPKNKTKKSTNTHYRQLFPIRRRKELAAGRESRRFATLTHSWYIVLPQCSSALFTSITLHLPVLATNTPQWIFHPRERMVTMRCSLPSAPVLRTHTHTHTHNSIAFGIYCTCFKQFTLWSSSCPIMSHSLHLLDTKKQKTPLRTSLKA